jgi:hypothetical protein
LAPVGKLSSPVSSMPSSSRSLKCCTGSCPPGSTGERLWELGLVSRLLADGSLSPRTAGLLALIETPEAIDSYLLWAQRQDDAKRRVQRCIAAVQEASRLAAFKGWLATCCSPGSI